MSMRPRAQIPLPEDEFPPPPHDVDLKLFNGFVVTTTSEVSGCHRIFMGHIVLRSVHVDSADP